MAWSKTTENSVDYVSNPEYLGGRRFQQHEVERLLDKLGVQLSRATDNKTRVNEQLSELTNSELSLNAEISNLTLGLQTFSQ